MVGSALGLLDLGLIGTGTNIFVYMCRSPVSGCKISSVKGESRSNMSNLVSLLSILDINILLFLSSPYVASVVRYGQY